MHASVCGLMLDKLRSRRASMMSMKMEEHVGKDEES